ncbi:MAG: right-handed parallel beta-helix repeat-containing protein, partial [Opitutales bacterium]
MKTRPKLLSLFIIALTHLTSLAQEPAAVIDAAKFESLQAAMDAVPAAGGLVKLPPGKFELTEPLWVHTEDTRLEGAGTATHLINKNEEGQPALLLRAKDYAKSKKKLWRIQLGNFRISGNPKSGDGLLAEGINEIFIQGVSIDHHGGHGINLVTCTEDPRVSDNLITYNSRSGLNIQAGHDIVVNANQFEENQDGLSCLDSFNLT